MLEESKELFGDLKKSLHKEQQQKAKRKEFLKKIKKKIVITLVIIVSSFVLLFPKQSGLVIGHWINDFFGTIMTESVKNIDFKPWMQKK